MALRWKMVWVYLRNTSMDDAYTCLLLLLLPHVSCLVQLELCPTRSFPFPFPCSLLSLDLSLSLLHCTKQTKTIVDISRAKPLIGFWIHIFNLYMDLTFTHIAADHGSHFKEDQWIAGLAAPILALSFLSNGVCLPFFFTLFQLLHSLPPSLPLL